MTSRSIHFQPRIVCGAAGSGKSYWIQQYAKEHDLEVLVCPCRIDRTLREQRTKLHEWCHRLQPSILWLEGADDLTPEAQSFLRRILETNSPSVHFILECRTIESIQEPIKSRCLITVVNPPGRQQLLDFAKSAGISEHVFTAAYDNWPTSKRTWRQINGLLLENQSTDFPPNVSWNNNIWNEIEKEFDTMTPAEQSDYLRCRHLGGNPFAFAALKASTKKETEQKDG